MGCGGSKAAGEESDSALAHTLDSVKMNKNNISHNNASDTMHGGSNSNGTIEQRDREDSVHSVHENDVEIAIDNNNNNNSNNNSSNTSKTENNKSKTELKLHDKLSPDSFSCLKVLGRGTFGKVQLVQKKDNERVYAMKSLRKTDLVKRQQQKNTEAERYILQKVKSPFLIELHYAFQDPVKLYLIMDFMGGGELFTILRDSRTFNETRSRLYAAEIICGLSCLHKADIAFRDLKTENLLLDNFGHIKICDFGLAKLGVTSMDSGAKTFCGTAELMAPEIYEMNGYGKSVDWWALGVVLYQMLHGRFPFEDQSETALRNKILSPSVPVKMKNELSKECKDALKGFLTRPVKQRLGFEGAAQIMKVPFFSRLKLDFVLKKQYEPEFKPPVDPTLTNLRGFDQYFTSQAAGDSVGKAEDASSYKADNFTYRGHGS